MNIIVTGATGGIGRECVKHLSKHNTIKVIAVSRSEKKLLELKEEVLKESNTEIDIVSVDFNGRDFYTKLAIHIKDNYGHLTYLVNNAGKLINRPFEDQSKDDVSEQLHINYLAPLQLIQALLPYMKKSTSRGHVVNISSMGGFQGSDKFPGLSVYSSSKAALSSLTECLAEEYKESNVSFNCLALGSANTEMLRQAFPTYTSSMSPERMAEFIVEFTLNGHKYFNGKVLPVAGTER